MASLAPDYVQPGVRYDLITGSGTNPYAGLDKYGRVIDCLWRRYSGTPADVDRVKYGYDFASNRLWRANSVAADAGQHFDELYAYDRLYQLKDMQRGELSGDNTAIVSGTLAFHETWGLDQTGNWQSYTQDTTGPGTPTLAQSAPPTAPTRSPTLHSTGPGWVAPQYDAAGNITRIPHPLNPSAGYAATWDAWNRLVDLADGASPIAGYAYDGLARRITATTAAGPRHFYYTPAGNSLKSVSARRRPPPRRTVNSSGASVTSTTSSSRPHNRRRNARQALLRPARRELERHGPLRYIRRRSRRYAYSAYGVPLFLDPSFMPIGSSLLALETLFCGYRYDGGVGLYLVRHRWLGESLGCWISRDLIGQSVDVNPTTVRLE